MHLLSDLFNTFQYFYLSFPFIPHETIFQRRLPEYPPYILYINPPFLAESKIVTRSHGTSGRPFRALKRRRSQPQPNYWCRGLSESRFLDVTHPLCSRKKKEKSRGKGKPSPGTIFVPRERHSMHATGKGVWRECPKMSVCNTWCSLSFISEKEL